MKQYCPVTYDIVVHNHGGTVKAVVHKGLYSTCMLAMVCKVMYIHVQWNLSQWSLELGVHVAQDGH